MSETEAPSGARGGTDAAAEAAQRRTAAHLQGELRSLLAEVRASRHLLQDPSGAHLRAMLRRANDLSSQVDAPREQATDAEVYVSLAHAAARYAQGLRGDSRRGAAQLLAKIRRRYGLRGPAAAGSRAAGAGSRPPVARLRWAALGAERARGASRRCPRATHALDLLGARPPPARAAAARRRRDAVAAAVRPENVDPEELARQAAEDGARETDQLLQVVHAALVRAGGRAGALELCLDPLSFEGTVENLFALSFLARDGYVSLERDDDLGIVVESLVGRRAAAADAKGAGAKARSQVVFGISKDDWRLWCERVKPEDCLLPHRAHARRQREQDGEEEEDKEEEEDGAEEGAETPQEIGEEAEGAEGAARASETASPSPSVQGSAADASRTALASRKCRSGDAAGSEKYARRKGAPGRAKDARREGAGGRGGPTVRIEAGGDAASVAGPPAEAGSGPSGAGDSAPREDNARGDVEDVSTSKGARRRRALAGGAERNGAPESPVTSGAAPTASADAAPRRAKRPQPAESVSSRAAPPSSPPGSPPVASSPPLGAPRGERLHRATEASPRNGLPVCGTSKQRREGTAVDLGPGPGPGTLAAARGASKRGARHREVDDESQSGGEAATRSEKRRRNGSDEVDPSLGSPEPRMKKHRETERGARSPGRLEKGRGPEPSNRRDRERGAERSSRHANGDGRGDKEARSSRSDRLGAPENGAGRRAARVKVERDVVERSGGDRDLEVIAIGSDDGGAVIDLVSDSD